MHIVWRYRLLNESIILLFIFIAFFLLSLGFPLSSQLPTCASPKGKVSGTVTTRMRKIVIMKERKETDPSFIKVTQAYWKAFQDEYAKEREKQVVAYAR